MGMARGDLGKILVVIGAFFLILAISFDFIYLAITVGAVIFFAFLYKNRKNFEHEIILFFALIAYFLVTIILVFFLGILKEVPPIYLGSFGGVLILAGIYLTGYLENLKR
ncbi:MAG: hypothetical protein KAT37_00240 [Candidatus Aenigmarchaeota archaeon]|nr:hypothetical protein [Candidatus Aenigmarchaeota archaeon]